MERLIIKLVGKKTLNDFILPHINNIYGNIKNCALNLAIKNKSKTMANIFIVVSKDCSGAINYYENKKLYSEPFKAKFFKEVIMGASAMNIYNMVIDQLNENHNEEFSNFNIYDFICDNTKIKNPSVMVYLNLEKESFKTALIEGFKHLGNTSEFDILKQLDDKGLLHTKIADIMKMSKEDFS